MPGFKIKEQEGYDLSTAEKETLEAITVLGDPGADRILFWDESANTWKFLTVGTGLNITATTLTSTGLSNPMTAIGDMIYGDTAGAVARLAGNTTTTKKFLTSVGDGTNSTAPAWSLDFSTDGTLAGNSDTIIPSQKAIKTYVDGSVAGLLDLRGGYDASGNAYPTTGGSGTGGAVMKGDVWIISVAGTLGGEAVQVGDSIIANIDTPAQTASNWNHLNANISYVPENVANKKTDLTDNSNTYYPSQKAVKTAVDAKAPIASPTFKGTVTLPKTTEVQDTTGDHQYVLAVSELTADRIVTLPLLTGNDTFMFKDFHKASTAEINTGTEDNKYITPDQLAGSNAFTKTVQQICVDFETELAVADGVGYIIIPAECNGMNLISARADVITAGTTNASTFNIYNVTDGTTMLSSAISIASGATSGTGTVGTAHDDVVTGDLIRIDCKTLSTTPPKGLIVTLAFRL